MASSTKTATPLDLSPSVLHHRVMHELTPELAFTPEDAGDVADWQQRLRRRVRRLLGYHRMPKRADRCPLNVRSVW
ncbi:MAG: hypothetical protein WD118_01960, partial [Phycisphaeraceae bacterium]